jgi:hypothetical protein
MNYIKQLEQERSDLQEEIIKRNDRVAEFRAHLTSDKFAPVQQDGSRGDWISVADVNRWLTYINQ